MKAGLGPIAYNFIMSVIFFCYILLLFFSIGFFVCEASHLSRQQQTASTNSQQSALVEYRLPAVFHLSDGIDMSDGFIQNRFVFLMAHCD